MRNTLGSPVVCMVGKSNTVKDLLFDQYDLSYRGIA